MKDNIFLLSDASYCSKTNIAGIGVVDTYNSKKYFFKIRGITTSSQSEFIALLYSIKIALKEEYNHVVFVYDCKNLDLDNLKLYIKDKFHSSQFLWLKRNFICEADFLAKKALSLSNNLAFFPEIIKKNHKLNISEAINCFSSYSYKQIIKSVMYCANKKECELLDIFLKGKYDIYNLPEYKSDDVQLYRFIYHMLAKNKRDKFYEFIISINPFILSNKEFKKRPNNIILLNRIELIINYSKKLN